MEIKVIGFCGSARSGKDTAAADFIHHANKELPGVIVRKFSMADTLKHMLGELYMDLGVSWHYDPPKEEPLPELGASPRKLMQTLGTDWARDMIDENFWTIVMRARLDKWVANKEGQARSLSGSSRGENPLLVAVIPDIRYDNEAGELCDCVVQVRREDAPEVRKHKSEEGVSPHLIDYTIFNNSDLATLSHVVKTLVAELMEKEGWVPRNTN
jgi:hypothetical protein